MVDKATSQLLDCTPVIPDMVYMASFSTVLGPYSSTAKHCCWGYVKTQDELDKALLPKDQKFYPLKIELVPQEKLTQGAARGPVK
ncbi:hypothetical protein DSO57_1015931, partial [Entomophthora muscae]